MTEFEHAILFFELAQTASANMANYMAIISAFIVVAYVVAHKLDRVLMILAIIIYSLFALGLTNESFQVYSDLSRLGIQMDSKFGSVSDTDLGWLGPVAMGADFFYILPKIIFTMLTLTYLGSIFFFFQRRRVLMPRPAKKTKPQQNKVSVAKTAKPKTAAKTPQ